MVNERYLVVVSGTRGKGKARMGAHNALYEKVLYCSPLDFDYQCDDQA